MRLAWAALPLGGLHALAFAPAPFPGWSLPWLQLAAFAAFCALIWRTTGPRQAAGVGAAFGMGHFAVGVSWIYISLHVHAYMAAPLAAIGVALLSAYLALYPALAAWGARRLARPWLDGGAGTAARGRLAAAVALAAAWTAGEWLRGVLLTGFPWLNTGYAHVDGPLSGWAPLLGVYGVAGAAALAAACLAALAAPGRLGGSTRRAAPALLLVPAALVAAATGARAVPWTTPHGEPLAVRLVQGNIPLSDKFDPALIWDGMERHRQLARLPTADGRRPDLVLMPETAVPVFQDQLTPDAWQEWIDSARDGGSPYVLGVALREQHPARDRYYNGIIALDGDSDAQALIAGDIPLQYRKRHLVPFGEFVPPGFRWFVDAMVMPLGDFDRGAARQRPFPIGGQRLALNICYEDVFGEELLPAIRAAGDEPGATILANLSNLAWFGDSLAMPQHLQMSRMRVRETGRPMLRATNTGATAVIDAQARVQGALALDAPGVLDRTVQGTTGLTPYARWGNVPVLGLVALALLALLATSRMSSPPGRCERTG